MRDGIRTSGMTLGGLRHLAWRDLWGPRAKRISLMSALSVTAICTLAIVVIGLLEMQVTLTRRRASCGLTFGDNRVREFMLTRAQIDEKEAAIRLALGPRSTGFLGCSPILEVKSQVVFTPPNQSPLVRTCYGRTVANAQDVDRMQLSFQHGGKFTSNSQPGVIVSPQFLRDRARANESALDDVEFVELGEAASVDDASRQALRLPIVGVTRHEFSPRWTFLILEPALDSLERDYRNFATRIAQAHPVPSNFTNSELPASLKRHLQTRGIDRFIRTPDRKLEFRAARSMDRQQWGDLLEEIRREMAGLEQFAGEPGYFSAPLQLIPESQESNEGPSVDERLYDFVSLGTDNPTLVEELVRLAEPLPADPALAASLRQLASMTRLSDILRWATALAVFFVGGVTSWAVQYLHAVTKRQEIGLLKAIGMNDRSLGVLFVAEGTIVAAFGVGLAVLACPIGMGVSCLLFEGDDEFQLLRVANVLWRCWGQPWLTNGGAAIAASAVAAWFGTWKARANSPIESFGAN